MIEQDIEKLSLALDTLGFLDHIPPTLFNQLTEKFRRVTFEAGDSILKQGRSGGAFFILISGKVSVWIDLEGENLKATTMEPVSYFGEIALLESSERTATLIAEDFVEVFSLGKKDFFEFFYSVPSIKKTIDSEANKRKKTRGSSPAPQPVPVAVRKESKSTQKFLPRKDRKEIASSLKEILSKEQKEHPAPSESAPPVRQKESSLEPAPAETQKLPRSPDPKPVDEMKEHVFDIEIPDSHREISFKKSPEQAGKKAIASAEKKETEAEKPAKSAAGGSSIEIVWGIEEGQDIDK
jgi:CRP-like cAMP-binding protein